jgi:hypothetical protein
MRRLDIACGVALAAPVVIAFAIVLVVTIGERSGATPFAGMVPANSAEAAGGGNAVYLIRFLRAGEDPRRTYPLRAEIISSTVLRATTLEAAMWSRHVEIFELLDREGAIAGPQQRQTLACLAADLDLDDIERFLVPVGAPDGASGCTPGAALARVLARTTGARESEQAR